MSHFEVVLRLAFEFLDNRTQDHGYASLLKSSIRHLPDHFVNTEKFATQSQFPRS